MKKIFSLFAAVLFVGSMMATDVTFEKADFSKSGDAISATKGGVTVSCTKGNIPSSASSAYVTFTKGATLTISTESGSITAIDFTSSGDSGYTGNMTDVSDISTDSWEVTVESEGAKTTVRVASIVVTVGAAPEPTACATPKFSLKEGTYEGAQSVEISCKTEGASIYYTVDGADPTTESAVYSAAIPVAATTTIKAFAAKDGLDNSDTVSVTYTIIASADVVLDFSNNTVWQIPLGSTKVTGTNSYTNGDYTITLYGPSGNGYYYDNTNNNIMLGKEGAYLQLPAFTDKAIARIENVGVTGGSASVKFNVYDGENAVSTEVTDCTKDQAFEISPKKTNVAYMIKVTSNANVRISKIRIWFGEADPATAIDNTELEGKAVKAIENGQLVIIKNGVRYNALGNVIR